MVSSDNPGEKKQSAIGKWLQKFLQSDQKIRVIFIIGIIGIVLIFFSQFIGGRESSSEQTASQTTITSDQYTEQLEQKLLKLIQNIEGVGQANIMVTLENGVEYVYANEEKKNTDKTENKQGDETTQVQQREDYEQNYILVDGSDGKEALIKTQLEPTVKGVVVVCDGGEQALVQQRVIDAVTVALDIDSSKVCVTKLSAWEDTSK